MADHQKGFCVSLPDWQPPCYPKASEEGDEDDRTSFQSACDDGSDVPGWVDERDAQRDSAPAAAVVEPAETAAADDAGDNGWRQQFSGTWRLVSHRADYDHWLALKVPSGFKRKIAGSLPATKRFVLDTSGNRVTHVYTMAGLLELTQEWNLGAPDEWREEVEAGARCLIASSWGQSRTLVIRKKFPALGLSELVENSISPDGATLIAAMSTTVDATGETRATIDSFVR
jgi:hypothetical protein